MRRLLPNICGLLALLFLPSPAHGTSCYAIAEVILNQENKGDFFFLLNEKNRLLFFPEDLQAMGIRKIPEGAEAGAEGRIYLDSLSPGVTYEFDEKETVLRLTAEPELLGRTTMDLSRRRKGALSPAGDTSAFLNYTLNYNAGDDFEFTSFSVPLEIGLSSGGYLGLSRFSYQKTDSDERFVRLLSSIIKDEPEKLRRIIAGDFPAFSGMLGSGAPLGGLSVSRKFSIDPYVLKNPVPDIHGAARNPSEVELYVNDKLVKREHVSPGEFEFLNLTRIHGAGDAVLVIRDASGLEERLTIPYYASSMLLRPGLHDYSYNLGFKREELGTKSFQYGDLAFLGFHRLGLSQYLTGGFRAEADPEVVNGGPTATFLLGRLGEVDTTLAYSSSHGQSGYGASSSYSRTGRFLSGRLFVKGLTREYANLALSPLDDKPRLEIAGSLGLRINLLGAFSLNYSEKHMHEGGISKRTSLYYSRRLTRTISLRAVATRTEAEIRTDEVFAGLTFMLGRSRSGHIGYRTRDDGASAATATIQKNPPLGKGFGYRLGADWRENRLGEETTGGNAFLQYRGDLGIYSAGYSRLGDHDRYSLNASGGLAFIGGSVYPTRPITDGFALVQVGNLEKVRVKYNNHEIGATGRNGTILIPGLISYQQNGISINDQDIPVNYELKGLEKPVSVPYRGGAMVRFDLQKLQGFTGRFFILENGTRTEAEYWGLSIRINGDAEESVVGKRGFFYLENVPPGKHLAVLFKKERKCLLALTIPESDEAMVDLGEVTCAME